MSTPELSVAIKAAQRLCGRSGGIPRPMSNPRSLSRSPSAQQLSTSSSSSSAMGSGSSVPSIAASATANGSLAGSLPPTVAVPVSAALPVPVSAALPVPVVPAATASLSSSELAAAVAAAAAAAGVSVAPNGAAPLTPAALGVASPVPRVSTAEHTLSALRHAGSSMGSGSVTPPAVTAAAVPVAAGAGLTPEQLLQQLAPAVSGGVQVPGVPLVPGVSPYAQLP